MQARISRLDNANDLSCTAISWRTPVYVAGMIILLLIPAAKMITLFRQLPMELTPRIYRANTNFIDKLSCCFCSQWSA